MRKPKLKTPKPIPLPPIRHSDLQGRWYDLARTNYLTIVSVAKGFVATTAAFVLLQIITSDLQLPTRLDRFSLWTAAMIGMVMTYQANSLGTVMMFWMPTYRDVLPTFLIGITEFLLFAILIPDDGSSGSIDQTAYWFGVFAFYALIGGSIAAYAGNQVRRITYEGEQLNKFMQEYGQRQRKHGAGAIFLSILWGTVTVWLSRLDEGRIVTAALSGCAIINMCFSLHLQESDLRWAGRFLNPDGGRQ
jgi:hypothetical protein